MRPQELNLLMVFDAIMTERSITRAADRLGMTQPAVSNAVSRMRVAWKDELFVKDGRNIRPTLHAQNLWDQIRDPLIKLTDAVDPQGFDPATSVRTFRVAVTDIAVDMVWAPMRKIIENEAPNINLHAIPYTIVNTDQVLEDAEVDMVIGTSELVSVNYRADYLFTPFYICVMRNDHPLAKADLSIEEFAAADHLFVSLSGDTTGYTDLALMQHGLTRRIACTMNHFSAVPNLLQESNLLCVLPATTVSKSIISGELAVVVPPLEIVPPHVSTIWHKRQDRDAGLIWLREHFKRIITQAVDFQTREIMSHMCPEHAKECLLSLNKTVKVA